MSTDTAELAANDAPPAIIASNEALHTFAEKISQATLVAVDTEADSLHCYKEKLCLIQISIPGLDEIIDPLSGIDLAPLATALADKEIILQGADFDLRMLRRSQIFVRGVFDTLIASRLIGETEVGYGALVKNFLGIELAKGSQKANWNQRPLPPIMLEYARNDTHYLLPLRDLLGARLRELGREEWFRQSCEHACRQAAKDREKNEDDLWRITGSGHLRGRAAAILRELWKWREAEAEARDRPCFHILQNSKMIEASMALDAGQTVFYQELRGPRLHRFHEAIDRAMNLPESEWPQRIFAPRHRWTQAEEAAFAQIKTVRDKAAAELNLDPSIIASRTSLETIARSPETATSVLLPWQLDLIGLSPTPPPTAAPE